MTTGRSYGMAALLVAGGLAVAGCSAAQGGEGAPVKVASVSTQAAGVPGIVTLADAAVQRLGLTTAPVTARPGGTSVPYGALVYEADGSSWVFVQTAPRSYQRARVQVAGITGDRVSLTSGPPVGTDVVTVGAAELVGVEIGIDGEE